jgi:hypothetical protein
MCRGLLLSCAKKIYNVKWINHEVVGVEDKVFGIFQKAGAQDYPQRVFGS